MIELGKMQKLIVVKKEDFGVYVGETLSKMAGFNPPLR